jgi:hypothetical protein
MPLKLVPPRTDRSPNWRIRGTYLSVTVDRTAGTPKRAIALLTPLNPAQLARTNQSLWVSKTRSDSMRVLVAPSLDSLFDPLPHLDGDDVT